jgi:hypothetical protein
VLGDQNALNRTLVKVVPCQSFRERKPSQQNVEYPHQRLLLAAVAGEHPLL